MRYSGITEQCIIHSDLWQHVGRHMGDDRIIAHTLTQQDTLRQARGRVLLQQWSYDNDIAISERFGYPDPDPWIRTIFGSLDPDPYDLVRILRISVF